MQPSEFWALTVAEFNALGLYITDYIEATERANRGTTG